MAFDEPHIDTAALEAITALTLVLASDHDAIRDEHTLEIYHTSLTASSASSQTRRTWFLTMIPRCSTRL
jgi:hypothetical protein